MDNVDWRFNRLAAQIVRIAQRTRQAGLAPNLLCGAVKRQMERYNRESALPRNLHFAIPPLLGASMDFLQLNGKTILVMGVANRKSVAYHIGKVLEEAGARVVYSVRNQQRRDKLASTLADREIYVCDVESRDELNQLRDDVTSRFGRLDGLVHSIAFADYDSQPRPFHETDRAQFLRACQISCFSLVEVSNVFRETFQPDASVVTISISTTRMASENYGFMAPIKAALDSSIAFLAKSFSRFSQVRFNAVAPGLLKTSASAGIPGYVDSYLYAERVIPRHVGVQTDEVANVAAFLLSPRASGINAQVVAVDAGMAINYFDAAIVHQVVNATPTQ